MRKNQDNVAPSVNGREDPQPKPLSARLAGGFAAVPNVVVDKYIGRIGAVAALVYLVLTRYAGPDGHCWPGVRKIAGHLGVPHEKWTRS
jgi:hypothetical protein